MSAELTVVWNGAHGGADRDLLCVPGIPEKREHVPLEPFRPIEVDRSGLTREAVERHLSLCPSTVPDLQQATGLRYAQVVNALSRLRKVGLLVVVGKEPKPVGLGRWLVVYGVRE